MKLITRIYFLFPFTKLALKKKNIFNPNVRFIKNIVIFALSQMTQFS